MKISQIYNKPNKKKCAIGYCHIIILHNEN